MLNIPTAVGRYRHVMACTGFLLGASAGAHAATGTDDSVLYRMTTAAVTAHEKPASFAVWNQPVAASAMTEARVPRHNPDGQFARALPAMGKRLEHALLAPAVQGAQPRGIAPFDMPAASPAFLGFVDLPWIDAHAQGTDDTRLILGFSRIAYVGNSALLYAEVCAATVETSCNGEAFWYRKAGSGWKLASHVQLWGGGIQPFWRYHD